VAASYLRWRKEGRSFEVVKKKKKKIYVRLTFSTCKNAFANYFAMLNVLHHSHPYQENESGHTAGAKGFGRDTHSQLMKKLCVALVNLSKEPAKFPLRMVAAISKMNCRIVKVIMM
jgi:hypothetical protein